MKQKMPNKILLRSPARRLGVTVIEVLFATGIAVAGMLGIASLLMIAGRNASQSNRSVETQALADKWYNEFLTRGMNNPGNWVWFQDYTFSYTDSSGASQTVASGLMPFGKSQYAAVVEGRLTHSSGSLGGNGIRPAGKQSVCLDPWFYSERNIRSSISAFNHGGGSPVWYRPAVFPYFQDGFNPVTDSGYRVGNSSTPPWRDQPRMIRATLGSQTAPIVAISEKQLASMFTSNNEMTLLVSDDDKTLPPQRGFFEIPAPAGSSLTSVSAQASYNPSYSWMATLSPLEEQNASTEGFYTLSLMVIHQRDRSFVSPPTSFVERAGPPDPDSKPEGERTTWIVPLSGDFDGGSGGRVRIIGSAGTSDSVRVGDWVMLSKHVAGRRLSGTTPIESYSVFRWYRVIGADLDSKFGEESDAHGGSDPYGNSLTTDEFWSRDVILDGPDWQFSPTYQVFNTTDGSSSAFPAPTTGTFIDGLIAVHERVVEIPEQLDF